ncbi:MAG: oligopeptidase B, partial [Thermoplasmata archaeon]
MTNVPPPTAKRVPKELALHGDVRVDNYYWIRDRGDPDALEYALKENEYTARAMEHTAPLQERLSAEIVSRIPEEDTSVPCKVDDYYYYKRMVRGKQYPIHCRRRGSMDAEEEVYLDMNELAEEHEFFFIDAIVTSPSHGRCAYTADTDGSERYRLFVKDLASGEFIDSQLSNVWEVVWGEEEDAIYYVVLDEVHRPCKVFKHVIGTNPEDDLLVYHEKDPRFEYLRLSKTKSRKYIVVTAQSLTKSEVWLQRSDGSGELWPLRARAEGVKYYATHIGDRFFVVTNKDAPNYKLMAVDESAPDSESWVEILPDRESSAICISDPIPWIEPFDDFLAMFEREGGLFMINILDLNDMTVRKIELPERFSAVTPMFGTDMSSPLLRFSCSSLNSPN